ncbi:hypothetical protein BKA56DRAFT_55644 [Ilyonectria sp. MPI-CAGE-AT-0026]|nr:hypothetical protein BKA56DRAFT_55644 [Ilyonectria sp. MPI-CAGE-AT-0026]
MRTREAPALPSPKPPCAPHLPKWPGCHRPPFQRGRRCECMAKRRRTTRLAPSKPVRTQVTSHLSLSKGAQGHKATRPQGHSAACRMPHTPQRPQMRRHQPSLADSLPLFALDDEVPFSPSIHPSIHPLPYQSTYCVPVIVPTILSTDLTPPDLTPPNTSLRTDSTPYRPVLNPYYSVPPCALQPFSPLARHPIPTLPPRRTQNPNIAEPLPMGCLFSASSATASIRPLSIPPLPQAPTLFPTPLLLLS